MKNDQKYFLYLISCKNHAKVGISSNIEARLKSLEAQNPFPVKLVTKVCYDSKKSALMCEQEMHKRLKEKGFFVKYEWFQPLDMVLNEFIRMQDDYHPDNLKNISDDMEYAKKKLEIFLGNWPSAKKKDHVLRGLERKIDPSKSSLFLRSILFGKTTKIDLASVGVLDLVTEIIDTWQG